MISFKRRKALGFLLASAGILLHANGALAAGFTGDAQAQASDLLSGTGGRANPVHVVPAMSTDHAQAFLDPQDQARQLILGKTNADLDATRAIARDLDMTPVRGLRRVAADPQDSARRMLLAVGI